LAKYVSFGISTDHEATTIEEAEEKIYLGMKILIREGSAAKNFDTLYPLIDKYPEMVMFCSDDLHPDDLVKGHINLLVKKSLQMGCKLSNIFKATTENPIKHYKLDVGMLRVGDKADFLVIDDPRDFNIKSVFINGEPIFENNTIIFKGNSSTPINNFNINSKSSDDFKYTDNDKIIDVIDVIDCSLITHSFQYHIPKVKNFESDIENDILKIVNVNRYKSTKPAIGFIHGFNIKKGAIASSISHDSHNILALGVKDDSITLAVNEVIANRGGITVFDGEKTLSLALPIAGLMSLLTVIETADIYSHLENEIRILGTNLKSPLMTLSFMALLVIPEIKISNLGLFDSKSFKFIE